jgi:hypothetical protein
MKMIKKSNISETLYWLAHSQRGDDQVVSRDYFGNKEELSG